MTNTPKFPLTYVQDSMTIIDSLLRPVVYVATAFKSYGHRMCQVLNDHFDTEEEIQQFEADNAMVDENPNPNTLDDVDVRMIAHETASDVISTYSAEVEARFHEITKMMLERFESMGLLLDARTIGSKEVSKDLNQLWTRQDTLLAQYEILNHEVKRINENVSALNQAVVIPDEIDLAVGRLVPSQARFEELEETVAALERDTQRRHAGFADEINRLSNTMYDLRLQFGKLATSQISVDDIREIAAQAMSDECDRIRESDQLAAKTQVSVLFESSEFQDRLGQAALDGLRELAGKDDFEVFVLTALESALQWDGGHAERLSTLVARCLARGLTR